MRRLILAALVSLGFLIPAAPASAHDLTCDKARDLAGHPNANCYKASPNHAWLWFPWHACQEHVYWSHYCDGPFCGLHRIVIVHCGTWSH